MNFVHVFKSFVPDFRYSQSHHYVLVLGAHLVMQLPVYWSINRMVIGCVARVSSENVVVISKTMNLGPWLVLITGQGIHRQETGCKIKLNADTNMTYIFIDASSNSFHFVALPRWSISEATPYSSSCQRPRCSSEEVKTCLGSQESPRDPLWQI